MSEVTVNQLASTVGIPVERLLAQLKEAGIAAADGDATLTEQEKRQLLSYLRRSHGNKEPEAGSAPSRVTLKRKSVSELRQPVATPRAPGGVRAATAPRAKTVSVEVRRKRTYVKRPAAVPGGESTVAVETAAPAVAQEAGRAEVRGGLVDDVRRRTELESRRAEEESRRLAEQEELERQAREEEARRQAEEEIRRQAEQEARRKAEEEAARARRERGEEIEPEEAELEAAAGKAPHRGKAAKGKEHAVEEPRAAKGKARGEPSERERSLKKAARKDSLRAREMPVEVEYEEEVESAPAVADRPARRKKRAAKPQLQDKHGFQRPTSRVVREVEIPDSISVGELAARMSVKATDLIRELFKQGMAVTINQALDSDTAMLLVEEMGHKPVAAKREDVEDALMQALERELGEVSDEPRPPVVTIMGHVCLLYTSPSPRDS